jgi:UDP-glucose 4-epimerase
MRGDGCAACGHAAQIHVATHSRQDFIDTNITGTLNLLEAAAATGSKRLFSPALRARLVTH